MDGTFPGSVTWSVRPIANGVANDLTKLSITEDLCAKVDARTDDEGKRSSGTMSNPFNPYEAPGRQNAQRGLGRWRARVNL